MAILNYSYCSRTKHPGWEEKVQNFVRISSKFYENPNHGDERLNTCQSAEAATIKMAANFHSTLPSLPPGATPLA